MAIDKNSKAYQNLLSSWYSDEQITNMYNQASSWQSRQEVVANTKPVWNTTPSNTQTTTPTETPTPVKEETVVKQEETVGSTVPEIKQEWELKPLSQDYYNQDSQASQDKIVANLNNYKQTNPEYFKDYESFKKNFSYDARNDVQKNVLDTWYKWYEQGLQLSNTPVNDLYTQYKDGQLSNTDLESLRITNPNKYAELQNQINKWAIIAAYDDTTPTEKMNFQDIAYQMIAKSLNMMNSWDYWTSNIFSDYEEKMNSPEMMELSDQTTQLEEDIKNVQDDIDRMKEEVEREYAGAWATRSKINAIIADRTYDLQLQLRTLNNEYTKYATQYNNRANQYQNEFQLQLQEYQLNMQARNQQMNELWFAMDLMNFETNEQKAQREWDYWVKQQEYTNWNINSKDYDTRYKAALKSVQNLLSQYDGIPMQRSAEQMAQDILTAIDNGSDLGAELTKINKQIQEKPEYKYLYNNTFWTKEKWVEWTYNIWGTEYVMYNWQLMTSDDFNKKYWWAKSTAKYTVVSDDVLKTYSDGRAWTFWSFINNPKNQDKKYAGQCGKFVNDYLEEIWAGRIFWNEDIKTREQWINREKDSPKVWTVAVFDYNNYTDWKNYGHVWIVISGVDSNGDFWVKDSNFGKDWIIQTRKVNVKDASLKWFIDPTLAPDGSKVSVGTDTATLTSNKGTTTNTTTQTTTTETTETDRQRASAMLKQIKSWSMTPSDMSDARDWLIEKWYGKEFEDALDKWLKVSLTDTQKEMYKYWMNNFNWSDIVQDFEKASVQMNNLLTALEANNWAWDLAAIFTFMKTLDPRSVVRQEEFENAAGAAWYANPSALWQKYVQHGWDGTWLTDAAKGNFWELAKSLIKSQAEFYNLEYDQLKQVFSNSNIDNQWLPTNYADYMIKKLDGNLTVDTTSNTNWYQQYQSKTPSWETEINVGGWMNITRP